METGCSKYSVEPKKFTLTLENEEVKFTLKNKSLRSCYYELFTPDINHLKIMTHRSFTLAPGIQKICRIEHHKSQKCKEQCHVIKIGNSQNQIQYVEFYCFKAEQKEQKVLDLKRSITLNSIKINQEEEISFPIKNVSKKNIKIQFNASIPHQFANSIQVAFLSKKFILLKNCSKDVYFSVKIKERLTFSFDIFINIMTENKNQEILDVIKVNGTTLMKNQYFTDDLSNKIENITNQMLNGDTLSKSFFIFNNYHESCPYKLMEHIEVTDIKEIEKKLNYTNLFIKNAEGVMNPFEKKEIFYEITTKINQNDQNFIQRYSQISIKDQTAAYKLRSSQQFKKNIEMVVKAILADEIVSILKIKNVIINPALRFHRFEEDQKVNFELINDSTLPIPYNLMPNSFFHTDFLKGKIGNQMHPIQIKWKHQIFKNKSTFKENLYKTKCQIYLKIYQVEICLYQPPLKLQRHNTAMIKKFGLTSKQLEERNETKTPSVLHLNNLDQKIKEVTQKNFFQHKKQLTTNEICQGQLSFLAINQNEKGYIFTNNHKSKQIQIFVYEKGYISLQPLKSYQLVWQKKQLKYEVQQKIFELNSKEVEEKESYKILTKQLIFCFNPSQKEFQVMNEFEISNRSEKKLTVYCLSIDDEYFHSMEAQHKLVIQPNSTKIYKISFFPQCEIHLKATKIVREIEFLVNKDKIKIQCYGDLLETNIYMNEKFIHFKDCEYTENYIEKNITLVNRGYQKINYVVECSEFIKITPKSGIVSENQREQFTISLCPAKISKHYQENIRIIIKGSHVLAIPLKVNTIEPEIFIQELLIDFKEGYLGQNVVSNITLVNNNKYDCKIEINLQNSDISINNNDEVNEKVHFLNINGKSSINISLKTLIKELGVQKIQLPLNWITLDKYGLIKATREVQYIGKTNLLMIQPEKSFQKIILAKMQSAKHFTITNLDTKTSAIDLTLHQITSNSSRSKEDLIINCQPNAFSLDPNETKNIMLNCIRINQQNFFENALKYNFSLNIGLSSQKMLYRKINFEVELPTPTLMIDQKQVYFPIGNLSSWSKSTFKIINNGYKEVFIKIKKPVQINFELDIKLSRDNNKLTKLVNEVEVNLFMRSKKPLSFGIVLEIQDNYEKKYSLKVYGTVIKSPLLNLHQTLSNSSSFSNKDIATSAKSLFSLTQFSAQQPLETENYKFLNKWFITILPQTAGQEGFNFWLRNYKNLIIFLEAFNCQIISRNEMSLSCVIEQLKKKGYLLYTLKVNKLLEGDQSEWMLFIWLFLSKEFINDDCLKWLSKTCQVNIETYENAFNYHKKILLDLISKIFTNFFKERVHQWSKIVQVFDQSLPILTKIQNKKQFILCLNGLYQKFHKIQKEKIRRSSFDYEIEMTNQTNMKTNYWILGSNSFSVVKNENKSEEDLGCGKKNYGFCVSSESTRLKIKVKESMVLAMFNNKVYDGLTLYDLEVEKKAPKINNIVISCQDKCIQQWKLNFLCQIQSEYFFGFTGSLELKCKMPDVGVIKAGEKLQFKVIYSPTNLKDHHAVLTISNKYEEYIYNLQGKPIQSQSIEAERSIKVKQFEKHMEVVPLFEDSSLEIDANKLKVTQIGEKRQQIKYWEIKELKKEITLNICMEFVDAIQDLEIIYQISNEEMTISKIIKLIIHVIPKPVIIKAELKAIIDRTLIEKIPIYNSMSSKQNVFIDLFQLTKEQYNSNEKVDYANLSLDAKTQNIKDLEVELEDYKLSHIGKLVLKPNEKTHINLSHCATSPKESYCQIRMVFEVTESIIVYNFMCVADVTCMDNYPTNIACEVEKQMKYMLKIQNKSREKMSYEVQTNLECIVGAEIITVLPRQYFYYEMKIFALHQGTLSGEVLFKNQKYRMVYPILLNVKNNKKMQKIQIQSKVRQTNIFEIQLANRLTHMISYDVICNSEYLQCSDIFEMEPQSSKKLQIKFTPLFVGSREAEIKLFNEKMQEIGYKLELISTPHHETVKNSCKLGEPKKMKIAVKNITSKDAMVLSCPLPQSLSIASETIFPILLKANTSISLEFVYTQIQPLSHFNHPLTLTTDKIGDFNYDLEFQISPSKIMDEQTLHYDAHDQSKEILRDLELQFLNSFDQIRQFSFQSLKKQYTNYNLTILEDEKFTLRPFQKKIIRCKVEIYPLKDIEINSNSKRSEENVEKSIIVRSVQKDVSFEWIYPVQIIRVFSGETSIEMECSAQELSKHRISLRHVKYVKSWRIVDFPSYKDSFNIQSVSSRELYLECVINKNMEFTGYVIFYDDDQKAEKIKLHIVVGEKKYQNVSLSANVGEIAKFEVRLKNGSGKFSVNLHNNKMKEFKVYPLQGQIKEQLLEKDNIITFEYAPVQYNGVKKAKASIVLESGCYNFNFIGKFPKLK